MEGVRENVSQTYSWNRARSPSLHPSPSLFPYLHGSHHPAHNLKQVFHRRFFGAGVPSGQLDGDHLKEGREGGRGLVNGLGGLIAGIKGKSSPPSLPPSLPHTPPPSISHRASYFLRPRPGTKDDILPRAWGNDAQTIFARPGGREGGREGGLVRKEKHLPRPSKEDDIILPRAWGNDT